MLFMTFSYNNNNNNATAKARPLSDEQVRSTTTVWYWYPADLNPALALDTAPGMTRSVRYDGASPYRQRWARTHSSAELAASDVDVAVRSRGRAVKRQWPSVRLRYVTHLLWWCSRRTGEIDDMMMMMMMMMKSLQHIPRNAKCRPMKP